MAFTVAMALASPSPAAPASGEITSERVFEVERFGRYAVATVSPHGTALRLLDRMTGPGVEDGEPGQRDGRVDLFLGSGAHKAILTAPTRATAPTELIVRPFVEMNGATLPRLVELATVSSDLGDYQQRSYWLEIPTRQPVFLEAAGRHLSDLRLWKDGSWLEDAQPAAETIATQPGRPLAVRRLVATLEPGLYLLVAYGGVGAPWTDPGAERPLHLRWGIPTLPQASRKRLIAGPFGFDRWLVPKETDYFRLELPEPGVAVLDVARRPAGQPRSGERALIDRTSRRPVADVSFKDRSVEKLVTIERAAGEPYVLQHYQASRTYSFSGTGTGTYLLSAQDPGAGEDEVDLGVVLTESVLGRERVVASRAVRLGQGDAWKRRFNLTDTVTLFVDIAESGNYQVSRTGVVAELSVEPFLGSGNFKRTPTVADTESWYLEAGLHVITIAPRPEQRGVITLSLKGASATEATEVNRPIIGATISPVSLGRDKTYRITLSRSQGKGAAVFTIPLPVDTRQEIPLILTQGETLSLPLEIATAGTLRLVDEDGTPLPLSVEGQPPTGQLAADHLTVVPSAKPLMVTLGNPRPEPVRAVLRLDVPPVATRPADLPPITAETLARLPAVPVLEAGRPRFLDLEKNRSITFAVKVDTPALYRVETTGLLETAGAMRTQVAPSLARAAANGVGRNFLLQQYLRAGLYQLTVSTQGSTQGHLGVALTATPVRDGGRLRLGQPARASLDAGVGLQYDFDVVEPGRTHVRATTLGGVAGIRLEDGDGWPLTTPDQRGDLDSSLAPGRYRLVVLPQALPARVVTLIERVVEPSAPSGHGPHALPLDGAVSARWEEPAAGGERVPDVWAFDLPATADVRLSLTEPMEGDIEAVDGRVVASFTFRRPFSGRLAAGSYRLKTRTIQPNNRVDYTVTVGVPQLTVGRRRQIDAPSVVPISIGREHLVEISSFGNADVRAVLRDASGTAVARSDDRPDDWNFAIAALLAPGFYTLAVEPVGAARATTTVQVSAYDERTDPPLAASGERTLTDGATHIVPLDLGPGGTMLLAWARSEDAVGLALERRTADGAWRTVGTASGRRPLVALPRGAGGEDAYRLRLWSLDHTTAPITFAVRTVVPLPASERQLTAGLALSPLPDLDPPLAVVEVALERPGLLQLDPAPPGLTWATAANQRTLRRGAPVVVAGGDRLWLVDEAGGGQKVMARRITPEAGAPFALALGPGERATLPLNESEGGPRLWLAESRVGQPGVAIVGADRPDDARTSGVAAGAAGAVLADAAAARGATLRLWRADAPAPGEEQGEFPLLLRRFAFSTVARGPLDWGLSDGELVGGGARDMTLPAGRKRLDLALPPRTAAALMEGDQVVRVVWATGQGDSETMDTAADRLLLLNTGAEAERFSVTISSAEGRDLTSLSPGGLASAWRPTAGTLRLEVKGRQGMAAHLSGPVESARLVQRNGVVRTGSPMTVGVDEEAVLMVRHRAGLLAAWLDGTGADAWPVAADAAPGPAAPGTVALSGAEARWRFEAAAAGLLHVRSSAPVLTGVRRSDGAPEVEAWPQGAAMHVFTPAGSTIVALRPLDADQLVGAARLTRSEAVAIGEGLGPKLRLAPGDGRLFSFETRADGPVGIGVRGSSDSVRVRLLDARGTTLSEGTVAMTDLKAGRYFLLVRNRGDAGSTDIQPALVGSERPDSGPPEDVKRKYWDLVVTENQGR
ncbi:MAG: hypothetical protein H7840_06520 [Alphaproteobacteria bacterium]